MKKVKRKRFHISKAAREMVVASKCYFEDIATARLAKLDEFKTRYESLQEQLKKTEQALMAKHKTWEETQKKLDLTKAETLDLVKQIASLQGYVDRFHYEERKAYIAANPVIQSCMPREMPVGGVQFRDQEGGYEVTRSPLLNGVTGYSRGKDYTPWYLR